VPAISASGWKSSRSTRPRAFFLSWTSSTSSGALYNPLEGHVDPSGVTQAYAKAARNLGAEVYRFTRVTELLQRPDGSWKVMTDKGDLVAEHVVNAAGLWAREVGRFAGLELPILAMEHQYLVTGEIPEVGSVRKGSAARNRFRRRDLHAAGRQGHADRHLRKRRRAVGSRAERRGTSRTSFCRPISTASPTASKWAFDISLRSSAPGIKKIVNGPFTFAPDGNPVVGPDPRLAQLLGARAA
jgi:dimethylglycine dehydrogenase